jgi:hypothetical protein
MGWPRKAWKPELSQERKASKAVELNRKIVTLAKPESFAETFTIIALDVMFELFVSLGEMKKMFGGVVSGVCEIFTDVCVSLVEITIGTEKFAPYLVPDDALIQYVKFTFVVPNFTL